MEGYFHIYNRGAHKNNIFHDDTDYWRFLKLLYIANSDMPFLLSLLSERSVFTIDRVNTLVDIIAYCLMPNHFHIFIHEKERGSMTKFMRKIMTGYTMYYNLKYDHSGTIFQGACKKKPVPDEIYASTLIEYIHLNPFGLIEPDLLNEAKVEYKKEAYEYSTRYEYSSLQDYIGKIRTQRWILSGGHTSWR